MKLTGYVVEDKLARNSETGQAYYYAGDPAAGKPAFLPLCAKTKTYKTIRQYKAAINLILNRGYEGHLEGVYIDEEVPDPVIAQNSARLYPDTLIEDSEILPDKPAVQTPEEPPPLREVEKADAGGWETIAFVGVKEKPPIMLRKRFGEVMIYAVKLEDGVLYYLPGDELMAWMRYYDECKRFVRERIRAKRIKAGKDPDGMDEWRDER